jgi:predicted RNase H-like HicB family nuclease
MEVSVVLERVANNGYRARCGEPLPASAEGDTREQALDRLRGVLAEKIAAGVEVVRLRVPTVSPSSPIWPDDEFTKAWLAGIAEARRQADEHPLPWEEPEPEQP